jgi:hypothetical protein
LLDFALAKPDKRKQRQKRRSTLFALFSPIMQAIKIIKPKQNRNEAASETKKTDEPSTRKIANTVKSWIEESQQRRKYLPRIFADERG